MKKEFLSMVATVVCLCIGVIVLFLPLIIHPISYTLACLCFFSALLIISISFFSYKSHKENYLTIKSLKDEKMPILAHWTYSPNTSSIINESIASEKASTFYTLVLLCMVGILIGIGIHLTGLPLSNVIAIILYVLFILLGLLCVPHINKNYSKKLQTHSEVIFSEDRFYYLDKLYTLQKNIYILDKVIISIQREPCIQFVYGSYNQEMDPVYTINVPIPEGQLETAKRICAHYNTLI